MKSPVSQFNFGIFTISIVSIIISLSSCSNELEISETTNTTLNQDQKAVIQQLDSYMKAFIKDASKLYDEKNDYIDIDALDKRIASYTIFPKREETRASIDESINILDNYNENLNGYLSSKAFEIIHDFISKGKNSREDYDNLKKCIDSLNAEDQAKIKYILAISDMFQENLNSVAMTRGRATGLPCNLMYTVAGSVTGSIWGAAFGGPVGWAIGLAWGVATTCVAYYDCIESE